MDEISEGDNEYFSGFTAAALKMANSKALEAYETAPMASPAVEREKKLIFVRQSFRVIRYQLMAEREDLRQFEKGLRRQVMTDGMREERVRLTTNINATEALSLDFERLFQFLSPADPFFSLGRVKRYNQEPDERRDNQQRDFDEDLEEHLPPKRRYREEYLEKSRREIERAVRQQSLQYQFTTRLTDLQQYILLGVVAPLSCYHHPLNNHHHWSPPLVTSLYSLLFEYLLLVSNYI